MGFEIVEFFLEVEQRFQISIPADDAQGIDTPRKLIDFLGKRLGTDVKPASCKSQHAFYTIRRAMISRLGVARKSVGPKTLLAKLVPMIGRCTAWAKLGDELRLPNWPQLYRPAWLSFVLLAVFCLALALLLAGLVRKEDAARF